MLADSPFDAPQFMHHCGHIVGFEFAPNAFRFCISICGGICTYWRTKRAPLAPCCTPIHAALGAQWAVKLEPKWWIFCIKIWAFGRAKRVPLASFDAPQIMKNCVELAELELNCAQN